MRLMNSHLSVQHRRARGFLQISLLHFCGELDASKDTEMHHFMALRHGKVICECNFAPYSKGMWHVTHSMCKSITGMAIGMLVEEGKLKLDENIYDIFSEHVNVLSKIFRPCDYSRKSADYDKRRNL